MASKVHSFLAPKEGKYVSQKRGGSGGVRRRKERLINQEDEKERKEAKENLGAGKGETVCFGSQDSHFFSSPKECELGTRKGERHFFGSKGPHFLAPDINPGAKKRGGNRA